MSDCVQLSRHLRFICERCTYISSRESGKFQVFFDVIIKRRSRRLMSNDELYRLKLLLYIVVFLAIYISSNSFQNVILLILAPQMTNYSHLIVPPCILGDISINPHWYNQAIWKSHRFFILRHFSTPTLLILTNRLQCILYRNCLD